MTTHGAFVKGHSHARESPHTSSVHHPATEMPLEYIAMVSQAEFQLCRWIKDRCQHSTHWSEDYVPYLLEYRLAGNFRRVLNFVIFRVQFK